MEFTYQKLYQGWRDTVTLNSEETNRAKYKYYLEDNLYSLLEALENETFEPTPLRLKTIYHPKKRVAQVPSLDDKIVQHVICDNYAADALQTPLIKETSACISGRGDGHASKILQSHLFNYYLKYGNKFYCAKFDIHSYFASIEHKRVISLVDRYIHDEDVRKVMMKFINMTDVGLPLGLQQSQLLANLYLAELDHKVKEELGVKYYGRYMDDFYIISNNYQFLEYCLGFVDEYVRSIGLELNPKTKIFENKIPFLGFTYHITETGKVIKSLEKGKKSSKRRQLKLMLKMLAAGDISPDKFADSYGGWRSHALRGDCSALVKRWDEWINNRLEELGYHMIIRDKSVKIILGGNLING